MCLSNEQILQQHMTRNYDAIKRAGSAICSNCDAVVPHAQIMYMSGNDATCPKCMVDAMIASDVPKAKKLAKKYKSHLGAC